MQEKKWYVIKSYNGKEKSVKEKIENSIKSHNFSDFVEKLSIPKETYIQIRKGKKIKVEKPLFSGYIYILMNMSDELCSLINSVDGVEKLFLSPMSETEVNNTFGKNDDSKPTDIFIKGEMVKIVDGPFKDFNGKITNINNNQISLIVKIFNRETPVALNIEQINKL